jgi:hypothetical protein
MSEGMPNKQRPRRMIQAALINNTQFNVPAEALNKDLEFITRKNESERKSALSINPADFVSSEPGTATGDRSPARNSLGTVYFERDKVSIIDVVLDPGAAGTHLSPRIKNLSLKRPLRGVI